MRKQVPPDKTTSVLDFATKRPNDRLGSIVNGLGVCSGSMFLADLLISTPRYWNTVNLNTFASLA